MRRRDTVVVHCTSPHRDLSTSHTCNSSVFCTGQNIRKFSETTGPTEAKFIMASP